MYNDMFYGYNKHINRDHDSTDSMICTHLNYLMMRSPCAGTIYDPYLCWICRIAMNQLCCNTWRSSWNLG